MLMLSCFLSLSAIQPGQHSRRRSWMARDAINAEGLLLRAPSFWISSGQFFSPEEPFYRVLFAIVKKTALAWIKDLLKPADAGKTCV